MEHASEDAPLATDSRAGSEEVLVETTQTRGASNSRALKIAGLTTLACLLLASQVFTAYMVFDQHQQIKVLQKSSNKMERQVVRASKAGIPMKMAMPMSSLPLLDYFEDPNSPQKAPKTAPPKKQQEVAAPSVEKQLQELLKDFELPHFNNSFLANLQSLKLQANETEWTNFETWLRHWLIFQMAQKDSQQAGTKCQVEAHRSMFGAYKPQCDEQGNYKPVQCWHATHYCWCVDENGTPIEGTSMRGIPDCGQGPSSRRTLFQPVMMPDLAERVNN